MDLTIIITYRCDSKCSMCYVWQNPTHPKNEIIIDSLKKLPSGFDNLNITGGEPTIRSDLFEIVKILKPKARTLEISSNGLHSDRLIPVVKEFPDVKIRFSLEGFKETNDRIRGEINGFDKKVKGLFDLKELGGKDLGFATVLQDDNLDEFVRLFHFTNDNGFEFATSTLHNGFQFHKVDNFPYDRLKLAKEIQRLSQELLKTNSVKNWFRAYLNLGLIAKVLGQPRILKCTAGTDFIFIDPWGDVYACNVRPDLKIGNINVQSWDEILMSEQYQKIIAQVRRCEQNCWMVTTARTAMRNPKLPMLPRIDPLLWVVKNKLMVSFGKPLDVSNKIDFNNIYRFGTQYKRDFFVKGKPAKRNLQELSQYYEQLGEINNI